MLQNIRDRSTGWISKVIVGLIVVLLSFTGFEAIMRSASNTNVAARVNDEEIGKEELIQAKNIQNRRLAQQLGQDFDINMMDDNLLTAMALNNLISRKLLLQGARESGFNVSSASIDRFLLASPDFQIDGEFNRDRFDQVIRAMGYGRQQFRQLLEQEILIEQVQLSIANTAFVTNHEVKALALLEMQTRDFATIEISPDLTQAQISDEEVASYYQANLPRYMTPEQVVAEYIEFKKSALAEQVEVTEAELQARYQEVIANLAEQRRAAHILFEINNDQSQEQALEKARQATERLAAGEDFAKVAKELSDDVGSVEQGGDLGFAGPDVYEPAFEQVLYALQKGQVSEPVLTEYGWHLIKLLDVQAAEILSFKEMEESLSRGLREEKVEQLFVEQTQELEQIAYESSDLQQPAQLFDLQVKVSPAFGRDGGEGVFSQRSVIEAAFSQPVLEEASNSYPLELDADTVIILRVKEHYKPEQIPLDQVSQSIRDLLAADYAKEQAKVAGETLLAQLRDGEITLQQAASDRDQEWQQVKAAGRMHDGVDSQLLQEVFKVAKPTEEQVEFSGISMTDGHYVIVQLTGVNTPLDTLTDEDIVAYKKALSSRQGQADFAAFVHQLEKEAKIERF